MLRVRRVCQYCVLPEGGYRNYLNGVVGRALLDKNKPFGIVHSLKVPKREPEKVIKRPLRERTACFPKGSDVNSRHHGFLGCPVISWSYQKLIQLIPYEYGQQGILYGKGGMRN